MKLQTKLILIALTMLCSCKESNRYKADTEGFNAYLKNNFKSNIGVDSAYYFLISETGCTGCIFNVMQTFDSNKKTIFIMSQAAQSMHCNQPALHAKVLIDSSDKINRLPFHKGNIALLMTSNNKIDTIICFETSTLDKQVKSIKNIK